MSCTAFAATMALFPRKYPYATPCKLIPTVISPKGAISTACASLPKMAQASGFAKSAVMPHTKSPKGTTQYKAPRR